jgi:hypothetical protein
MLFNVIFRLFLEFLCITSVIFWDYTAGWIEKQGVA